MVPVAAVGRETRGSCDAVGMPEFEVVIARADLMNEEDFRRIRVGLPADRQERCDAYYRDRDRYSSAVSYALLQYLWRERWSGPMPAIERAAYGKPRFSRRPEVEFNWSHDAGICVCAMARRRRWGWMCSLMCRSIPICSRGSRHRRSGNCTTGWNARGTSACCGAGRKPWSSAVGMAWPLRCPVSRQWARRHW